MTTLLLLAQLAASAPAEGTGAPIVLPCTWEKGAVYHYSYVRRRTDSRNPVLAEIKTTTPATIEVVASELPGSATFRYDTGEPVFEGPQQAVDAVKQMMGDADMPSMDLKMTEGSVTEIANHAELMKAMEPMLDKMFASVPKNVAEQTKAMFRDPVMGTQLLLKEPGKLFALHCVELREGQVVELPMEFPNPFGGPPLAGHSRIAAVDHDPAKGTLTIETTDSVSPEAIKAMLPQLVERFAPDVPIPDGAMDLILAQLPPIDNTMTGRMVYSTADGFPLSVDVTQQVGAKDHPMSKSDTWTWTRVEAPKTP